MSKLKIYRASAGSGKTYTLAGEFIRLLFKDPSNYKYILAVTFTNKATAEMKNRILENLYALTFKKNAEFLEDLMTENKKSEKAIRSMAARILHFILNDFSHLSVSTIDSFFQRIIRSFAFEAGLAANLKIELDNDKILKQALDELLQEIEVKGNEGLKEWLLKHTMSKIEEGSDWKILNDLTQLGREVFKEEFQSLEPEMLLKLRDKTYIDQYQKQLLVIQNSFEKNIRKHAADGLKLMKTHAISWDIVNKKSRSPLKILEKLAILANIDDVHKIQNLAELVGQPDLVIRKDNAPSDNDKIIQCFADGLSDLIKQLVDEYYNRKEAYFTSKSIGQNLYALGILSDVALKIRKIANEQSLFLLSDANQLLNKIVAENEAPFIYEKTGTCYKHYMIDEFQDTSRLQWQNFKPLILNSISEDNTSLVVGDVKQSIYRWRNSDWKLLSDQVQKDFHLFGCDELTLATNWRSYERVIQFNNFIFKKAADLLQQDFIQSALEIDPQLELPEDLKVKITNAYHDIVQKVSPGAKDSGGYINIQFTEAKKKEEYTKKMLPKVAEAIDQLITAGYQYNDICILVRKKGEGQLITESLLSGEASETGKKYPIISNEALVLGSSPAVNMVVHQLKYIQMPDNEILQAYINLYQHFYDCEEKDEQPFSPHWLSETDKHEERSNKLFQFLSGLKGQPFFEMAETLARHLPEELKKEQSVFIQGFLDVVRDYITNQSVNLNDFIDWWDDRGYLAAISIPEEQNAIKVMTIHKSKGLEFKAVLLPFCDWELEEKRMKSLIWCTPKQEPFNQLDLVPVNYSSKLIHTHFFPEYLNEKLHQYVDNINLLYVAFTRARESLITFCKAPAKLALNTASDLLWLLMSSSKTGSDPDHSDFIDLVSNNWDEEEKNLVIGEIPTQTAREETEQQSDKEFFKTISPGSRIKIHTESDTIQLAGDNHLQHGKLMHQLFERIRHKQDVEKAIDFLVLAGKIPMSNRNALCTKISELISLPFAREWFEPSTKVVNEGDILVKTGSYRPDRVMFFPQQTMVVDYKFGEVESEKHIAQVRHYLHLLRQMGYKKVEGYLWYIREENHLVKVEIEPEQGRLF